MQLILSRLALSSLLLAFFLMPLQAQSPDLTVTEVDASSVSTDCQTLSATGTIRATVKNIGMAATDTGFTVVFFEDRNGDGLFQPGIDLFLGDEDVTDPLAPDEERTVSASVNATVSFAGNLMYVLADSGNAIPEEDESNNGNNSGSACEFRPPVGSFLPVLEWSWTSSAVSPNYLNVMSVPGVVDLNADGIPDVVFGATNSTSGALVEVGVLRALSGADGTELFTVTDPALRVNTAASVAVGDIDLDGRAEILAADAADSVAPRLIAFEHDGTFKWRSAVLEAINWGAPALADLNADGAPEIVVGRQVLDNDGNLLWTGTGGRGSQGTAGPLSLVADIDLDGSPDVVAGNTVYRASGTILWVAEPQDGYNAVGNFDADPYAEIVLVTRSRVYLLEHNGAIKWSSVMIPGGGAGGPPTVDDFDSDGEVEIGVAGAERYAVFETNGALKWASVTQDGSSNRTGSSIFDFEGDGSAEVVYSDELTVRVYAGSNGAVLFETPLSSCTWHEFPLVADVDADGNAEIIAVANNNCGFGTQRGIFVYGDSADNWVSTRRIWNQHTYHITNVNDDATIPAVEANNWLEPRLNNFRAQVTEGNPFAAPDLTASFIRVDDASCPESVGLTARLGNGGANVAAAPINVAFYDGDPASGGTLLGVTQSTLNLDPGEFEDVQLLVTPALEGPRTICAVADDNGSGLGFLNECDEDNNKCCTEIESFCNAPPELSCLPAEVCNDPGECSATLDCDGGVASCFDPDGDPTTLTCDPTSPYSVGVTNVSVTCEDGRGGSDEDECTVVVTDCEGPSCNAPPDMTFECNAAGGVSSDDPVVQAWLATSDAADNCSVDSFANDAPGFFTLGTTLVTWTATDEAGNSSQCSSNAVVRDTTPPACNAPPNMTFECNTTGGVSGNDPAVRAWLDSASAVDGCTPLRSFTNNAPPFFPLGRTPVTWTAVDEAGNTSQCSADLIVNDTTPPEIDVSIDQCCLWSPNHKFVDVGTYTVSDVCDPHAGDSSVVAVTTDEHPATERGAGGPQHCPDALASDGVISLRAERSGRPGKNNGRVYGSITVSATDASGNEGTMMVFESRCPGCPGAVCVPHDQNPKSPGQTRGNRPGGMCLAIDDGQRYEALICK